MGATLIEIDRLSVHYDGRRALSNLTLQVREGELFGILGPNGAGKTTLFSILAGLKRPTRGTATVDGKDCVSKAKQVQNVLGIVPQTFAGYEILTGMENLYFFGSMYGVPKRQLMTRARTLLGLVSLQQRAHDPVSSYSGGMRHRLNIILALIHEPKIVIMDEPTTGLDPIAREELWAIIRDLRKRGATILLTTHYMQEAQALCDRVAIIDRGNLKLVGAPREMGQDLEVTFRQCVTSDAVTDRRGDPVGVSRVGTGERPQPNSEEGS